MSELLRFITCGSVDDGKSTLIGRLLLESGQISDDHLASLESDSKKFGTQGDAIDAALLLDGLQAEREQGITIDVAYRHFSTTQRRFLVADTPGHVQYTRNMATGASTADLAVILVDARKGIVTQTKRHTLIVDILGIRSVILAVNKMDLVAYSQDVFESISKTFARFVERTGIESVQAIPVSGLQGDNIHSRSDRTQWFEGPTLIGFLEGFEREESGQDESFRLAVQLVSRPSDEFRGFQGLIVNGAMSVGDSVLVQPSGTSSFVDRIVTMDGELPRAFSGQSVTVCLRDEIDVSRGDVLAASQKPLLVSDQFRARVVWMNDEDMLPGRDYLLKIGTKVVGCSILRIKSKLDVETLGEVSATKLELNDIGDCEIGTKRAIAFDSYRDCRSTGGFLIIDRVSCATLGAGMIDHDLRRGSNVQWHEMTISKDDRRALNGHASGLIWLTGLSGSGKSTIANGLEQILHRRGIRTYVLDGDNLRHGLSRDLGFTPENRVENLRRAGEVARILVDSGIVVIASFVSPYFSDRRMVREMFSPDEFLEVHIDAPLEVLKARDPKGLYSKALRGEIPNFTGISAPYEPPSDPDLRLDTGSVSVEESVSLLVDFIDRANFL